MPTWFERWNKHADLALALGLVGILGVIIIPLPSLIIDLLIALALVGSVVLLLTAVYVQRALDFSVFPSILLVMTLFRLSLNVATTRIILIHGSDEGTAAAGAIIKSFGEVVIQGNYAVGIVIFLIFVIINFIVITKGAGRVAEVAARFTLDAMPGKQMAIDADLNAGIINEDEARKRRSEIAREADFYGAMDGASKFIRGDAIAGILIVVVNVIGGIIIGTLQRGMTVGDAATTFALLTIGDGLVSQIPALIISTAAGIIVTRTGSSRDLGRELSSQIFTQPKALYVSSAVAGVAALVPSLPAFPFLIISAGLGFVAYKIKTEEKDREKKKVELEQKEKLKPTSEKLENLLSVDVLELEVGYGLINIVDVEQKGDLLERISNIRKQFALDMGVIVPPIRIRDNLELKPGDYLVLLKGVAVGNGSLMIGHLLAMDPGNVNHRIAGVPTKEPAFGLDAIWIPQDQKEEATYSGYTVVDLSTVIATHLTEIIRTHVQELLGRQEFQTLVDQLKQSAPKVVEDLIPGILPVGTVLKVCRNLLKEGVSIRDLRTILESLAEYGVTHKDPASLTEFVRSSMGRNITKKLLTQEGQLKLLTLDKTIEETIAAGIIQTDQGHQLSVDPDFVRRFIGSLNERAVNIATETPHTVVLCSPMIRTHLKSLIDRFIPNVVVLSHNEINHDVQVKAIDTVRLSHAS